MRNTIKAKVGYEVRRLKSKPDHGSGLRRRQFPFRGRNADV